MTTPTIRMRVGLAVVTAVIVGGLLNPVGLTAADAAGSTLSTSSKPTLVNGEFDNGTQGWRTNRKRQVFTTVRQGSDRHSGRLSMAKPGRMLLKTTAPAVASASTTATYVVTARVRATGSPVSGRLRVRELADGSWSKQHAVAFRATKRWKVVRLTVDPTSAAPLQVAVVGLDMRPGRTALLIDRVRMTTTDADLETPPAPAGCVKSPMGIPPTGQTYLGGAVNGTSDLPTREKQLGQRLALHRTYFKNYDFDKAVKQAKADLADDRLPWISFKAPLSWERMAAGDGDAWITQLSDALATVPGPVWLAVHHEPEGDGDMAVWTAMQRRIAPIVHARTDNVAYSVIYSGWNTYGAGKDTVASKWPGDANVDILAIDAYNDYGVKRGDHVGTKALDLSTYFKKMSAWAKAHHTAWALGETGQSSAASAVDPDWIARSYQSMVELGGAGFSYYDSSANSVADWTLDDRVKFASFHSQLPASARLC